MDEQLAFPAGLEGDVLEVDARLPAVERDAHGLVDARERVGVDPLEDAVVHGAAELRAHRPFAGRGREDDPDRLLDVDLLARQGDPAAVVDAEGEREPGAEDGRHPSITWAPEICTTPLALMLSMPALMVTWPPLSIVSCARSTSA